MKPVNQKITNGHGDCVSACIASILEKDIEEIPYLFAEYKPKPDECWGGWLDYLNGGLVKLSKKVVIHKVSNEPLNEFYMACYIFGGHENQLRHCVVEYNNDVVHDPS